LSERGPLNVGVLIREALAVLAAILIAFSLDAWWDGVQGRARAREAIEQVWTELEYNRPVLEAAIRTNKDLVAAVEQIRRLSPSEVDALPDDSLRVLLIRATSLTTFDPSLGAATAAISSGVLETKGMDRLPQAIATWLTSVSDLDENRAPLLKAYYDFHVANASDGLLSALAAITDGLGEPARPPGDLVRSYMAPGNVSEMMVNLALWVTWYDFELVSLEDRLEELLRLLETLR